MVFRFTSASNFLACKLDMINYESSNEYKLANNLIKYIMKNKSHKKKKNLHCMVHAFNAQTLFSFLFLVMFYITKGPKKKINNYLQFKLE